MLPSTVPQQVTENMVQNGTPYEGQRTSNHRPLALCTDEDDPVTRQKYRPFILPDDAAKDWVSALELTTALDMAEENLRLTNERLR
ncbi:arsenic resistance protein ArsH, partial [Aspergillus sclerotialis]